MTSSVAKWGNSLAVRLPQNIVKAAKLSSGTRLEIELKNNQLILKKKTHDLDDLVGKISPANTHSEIRTGKVAGKETW